MGEEEFPNCLSDKILIKSKSETIKELRQVVFDIAIQILGPLIWTYPNPIIPYWSKKSWCLKKWQKY